MRNYLVQLNRTRGITIVISSHVLDQLERMCTHYGIIANGRMVWQMTAEQVQHECGERYAGVEMDADDAALLGMFADRTVPNHSFLLVFMGFFQGGMAGLLVSIIATLAYAEDHEHGFVKAELAGRAGRIGYYASHLVLAALLAAWYSLVVIASTELAFAVFGIRVADPEPFGQYWRLAGLNILGVVAVTLIVTALHTIVRSKVAGVIIAVFVASGAVSSLAESMGMQLYATMDGMTLSITLDMGPAVHGGTGPGASMT